MTSTIQLLSSILVLILHIHHVHPFAAFLVDRASSCWTGLEPGEIIMNYPAIPQPEDLPVQVELLDVTTNELFHSESSKLEYYPGLELKVRLDLPEKLLKADLQFALEVSDGAEFNHGGCEGRRISGYGTGEKQNIVVKFNDDLDADSISEVSIWAGWALEHEAVKLTPKVTLSNSKLSSNTVDTPPIEEPPFNDIDLSKDDIKEETFVEALPDTAQEETPTTYTPPINDMKMNMEKDDIEKEGKFKDNLPEDEIGEIKGMDSSNEKEDVKEDRIIQNVNEIETQRKVLSQNEEVDDGLRSKSHTVEKRNREKLMDDTEIGEVKQIHPEHIAKDIDKAQKRWDENDSSFSMETYPYAVFIAILIIIYGFSKSEDKLRME